MNKLKETLKNNYKKIIFISLPIIILMITIDLLTKFFANKYLAVGEQKDFIPGFIDFFNVHNNGGAWNIFAGNQIFLIIFTSIFILLFIAYYLFQSDKGILFHIASSVLIVGCLGNLIDRIAFSYVRDMIHFAFWPEFPVFNVADICVCVGIFLLLLSFVVTLIKSSKKEDQK